MPVPVAHWPEQLGTPQVEGYGRDYPDTVQRTDTADGAPIYRQYRLNPPFTYKANCIFSDFQHQLYESFWYHTLKKGLYWYTMPCMMPSGMVDMVVHMLPKTIDASYQGGNNVWSVGFQFETMYGTDGFGFPDVAQGYVPLAPVFEDFIDAGDVTTILTVATVIDPFPVQPTTKVIVNQITPNPVGLVIGQPDPITITSLIAEHPLANPSLEELLSDAGR